MLRLPEGMARKPGGELRKAGGREAIAECIGLIKEDAKEKLEYLGLGLGPFRLAALYLLDAGFCAVANYRISQVLLSRGHRFAARLLMKLTERATTITISIEARIGRRFCILHGHNIVIGGAEIGDDCHVMHGVTVGGNFGKRRTEESELEFTKPRIGNNVFLAAGCAVIGPVVIGDGVIVGANSVVSFDVPANSVVRVEKAAIMPRDSMKGRFRL